MQEKIVVFTGPSLHPDQAKTIYSKATYLPPIKRGDATKAFRDGAKIIAIIDGVFFSSVAVSPRELIDLLDEGVIIIGGSSMGALRAAELDAYGMKGVGLIYNMYKKGIINSDDEVALIFSPDTLQPLSEPLVNIRYNFEILLKKKVLNEKKVEDLIQIAKNLYYPSRKYETIIETAVNEKKITDEEGLKVSNFIQRYKVNLKSLDALKVLKMVKEISKKII